MAVALLGAGCGNSSAHHDTVVVAAASSLAEVIEQAAADLPRITPVVAGSSTLVAQLEAGAETDVLITADTATMDRAITNGAIAGESTVIATNKLVLATPVDNPGRITGLADLARHDLLVGVCDFEVPCGRLARQALEAADTAASFDTLEPNVRALTTKLVWGELDAGLIYQTNAREAGLHTVDAPELQGHLNHYHIAAVSADPSPTVQAVLDAFTNPEGAGVAALRTHGFETP